MLSLPFPGAGGSVSFWFRDTTYQNNSLVTLEDIGIGGDDALLCVTDLTACCQPPYSGTMGPVIGNWFFPNGTRISEQWEMYRTRGQSVVRLHCRSGGVNGIYRCVISDAAGADQTITIGVYTADTGE